MVVYYFSLLIYDNMSLIWSKIDFFTFLESDLKRLYILYNLFKKEFQIIFKSTLLKFSKFKNVWESIQGKHYVFFRTSSQILSFLNFYFILFSLTQNIYFYKILKIIGLGFRFVILKTQQVRLDLGWSHVLYYTVPSFLFIYKKNPKILICSSFFDKLGTFCAIIISLFTRSPYQLKGIFYLNEYFKKKIGKQRQK